MKYHTPLTRDELRELSIPEPWSYGTADRVRFGEIDALNHVNHTAYLRWFETFRINYFRDYGISNYDDGSPRIVLKSITAEFIQEMVVAQDYIVTGRTTSFRNTSWVMEYAVWTDQGLMTTGSSVIVQLDPTTGAKLPLSASVRETLITRDGASQA
ncbi:MAG: thioesterase family protein [Litoreibacter sp.]|nr:thioesterase family protein [Litoreibacter sp.]